MKPRLKPDFDPEAVQAELVETVCNAYKPGVSVRFLAKEMGLSPMKIRKILITGGVYATDLSTEIDSLWKDGKKSGEIAEILKCSVANVNSYLPYERIIYGMEERSAGADRQSRYRERKKAGGKMEKEEIKKVERRRTETLIIIIGKKLRKLLPEEVLDGTTDPLAREKSFTWDGYENGEFVHHVPADPDRRIWCAEVTSSGRGKAKKQGVVLMSAHCGFAVMAQLPPVPSDGASEERACRHSGSLSNMSTEKKRCPKTKSLLLKEGDKGSKDGYRSQLEETFLTAIRDGFLAFSLSEERVRDYTDTVARVELVKGRGSIPAYHLEELINHELNWKTGDDPVSWFNIRGNFALRKFGCSDEYRSVDRHTCEMLWIFGSEYDQFLEDFFAPVRESLMNPSRD